MKTKIIIFISAFCQLCYSQLITNTSTLGILASDNFESQSDWSRCAVLNNQLGGTANYNWYYWDGQMAWPGVSATGGTKSMGIVWGGIVPLSGFSINVDSIYQIECLVHPTGDNDGTWNNWSGIHLYASNSTNIWQSTGVRVRLQNGSAGTGYGNPSRLIVELWEGASGTYRNVEVANFSSTPSIYSIDGTAGANYWIPLKLIFTGGGTSANPLKIDYFLNNTFVGSTSFDDLSGLGENMIGLARYGNSNDHGAFDNFILTKLKPNTITKTGSSPKELSSILYDNLNHTLEINFRSNNNAKYQLFNCSGVLVLSGCLSEDKTSISMEKIGKGLFIIKLTSGDDSKIITSRILIK